MESPEVIAAWRDRVARAKSEFDALEEKRKTAAAHAEWTRGVRFEIDSKGKRKVSPVDGRPIRHDNATQEEQREASAAARKAALAAREARERLTNLRKELANAEKSDPLPIEHVERQLHDLVAQDSSLYEQLEDQIRALRAMVCEWNAHIDAKQGLRAELGSRGAPRGSGGMLGKVDARWNAWLTADFRDDAALSRQFGLMARGQGYMNPLPTPMHKAVEAIRASTSAR